MSLKYHKIMISANVISTGFGILESIKIHIENCCHLIGLICLFKVEKKAAGGLAGTVYAVCTPLYILCICTVCTKRYINLNQRR